MSEIMFSHQKRVKKPFFLSNLPPGGLVLPNKSQLSNLQNALVGGWIEKKAFLTLFWWENMISDMSSDF